MNLTQELSHRATITNGKLIVLNRDLLNKHLATLEEGEKVDLYLVRRKSKRSISQNNYYWKIITILANELGYDKDEMHEIMKYKFLRREKVDEVTGEVFEYIQSTSKLEVQEFVKFTEDVIRFSSQTFNVILPSPDQF